MGKKSKAGSDGEADADNSNLRDHFKKDKKSKKKSKSSSNLNASVTSFTSDDKTSKKSKRSSKRNKPKKAKSLSNLAVAEMGSIGDGESSKRKKSKKTPKRAKSLSKLSVGSLSDEDENNNLNATKKLKRGRKPKKWKSMSIVTENSGDAVSGSGGQKSDSSKKKKKKKGSSKNKDKGGEEETAPSSSVPEGEQEEEQHPIDPDLELDEELLADPLDEFQPVQEHSHNLSGNLAFRQHVSNYDKEEVLQSPEKAAKPEPAPPPESAPTQPVTEDGDDDVGEDEEPPSPSGMEQQAAPAWVQSVDTKKPFDIDDMDDEEDVPPISMQSLLNDPLMNDKDELDNSAVIEELPPIGEIVATEQDDNVSDIAEAVTDDVANSAVIDGVEIIYNPADTDICFDDRGHPGTKEWIVVIRECLQKFEGQEYSPPVYKAIKKKLKGRKFLIRTRRNERTSWREATKPEVIELFGECFNEERRRQKEGITSDNDSEIDDSLQDSAKQSDASLSIGVVMQDKTKGNQNPTIVTNGDKSKPNRANSNGTPTGAPTPRMGNLASSSPAGSGAGGSPGGPKTNGTTNMMMRSGSGLGNDILQEAIAECQSCEDYISPYDDTNLLEQGIAAEQKLKMLTSLADGPQMEHLKNELEKIDDLATRMRHASMAPLLEILTKIERHMTEYFQLLAEQASEPNLNYSHVKSSKQPQHEEKKQESSGDVVEGTGSGGRAAHQRSIQVDSDRAARSSARKDTEKDERINGHRDKSDSAGSAFDQDDRYSDENGSRESRGRDDGSGHALDHDYDDYDDNDRQRNRSQADDGSLDSEEGAFGSDQSDRSDRYDDEEEIDYNDQGEPLDESGSVALGEALRVQPQYEMPLGGSYDDSSRFGSSLGPSGRSMGRTGDVSYSGRSNDDERGEESYVQHEVGLTGDDSNTEDVSQIEQERANHDESNSYEEDVHDTQSYETEPEDELGDMEEEGSQSLKDGVKVTMGDSPGNMDGGVLELSERGIMNDDMSSVGRSMPGIYGSDSSDSENDDEYEEYVIEDEDEDEDDSDESDKDSDDDSESKSRHTAVQIAHEDIPNPKVEQFFDRLQHFFEVRRKMEERADLMDPSNKFRGLRAKCHSDGIVEDDGYFKEAYQQRDLRNRVVRNLDDLYDAAEPAQKELERVLESMLMDVKGMDKDCMVIPPLKGRNRAYEKAKQEYSEREPGPAESWLYDVVRASVFCKSYKQMADVNKWLGNNTLIVSSKNRFAEPNFNGYRDLLFHVSIPYRGQLAHICEVQVHHKDIHALDQAYGLPKHHEFFRSSFAGPWRSQEETLDDLAMLNMNGEIGGKVMKTLLKSKDPDQLRLVAGICREVLGEYDRALELYRRVLLLQLDSYGDDHEDVASTYLCLGLVLGAKGETVESLENLERALRLQERLFGADHLKVAETQAEIGHMLIKKGDFPGALKEFRKSQKIRESKLGKEHFLVINSLQDIGRVLRELGEYKNSEAELRRALKIQEAVLGDVHNDVAVTQAMIGTTLCQYGDFGKAMECHRLALSIRETNLGKNHPLTADSHTDIGIVLCQKGDFDVAEWRHKKALRIRETVLGKEAEACSNSHISLGKVLARKLKYDDAIEAIKRAQEMREQHLGMDNTITAESYLELGNVYLEKKDYDSALKEFRRGKVVRESFLGQSHPDTAIAYNCLGNALNVRGDHDAALAEHRRALEIYEQVLGKNHPKTATGYQCVADVLLAKGERDEALIEHRKALSVRANVLAKDHPDTATSCARIGNLLYQKGDLVGASVAYRQALAITVGLCGEQHGDSAKAHIQVGKVLAAQGDYDEALEEVEQATAVIEKAFGKNHEQTGLAYSLLGTIYGMAENHDEALTFHQKAIPILEKSFGKKSKEAMEARKKLLFAENEEAPNEL